MRTDVQQTIYPEQGDVHAKVRLLPDSLLHGRARHAGSTVLHCWPCWLCAGYVLAMCWPVLAVLAVSAVPAVPVLILPYLPHFTHVPYILHLPPTLYLPYFPHLPYTFLAAAYETCQTQCVISEYTALLTLCSLAMLALNAVLALHATNDLHAVLARSWLCDTGARSRLF
jgi:hypothetical protein